MIDVNLFDNVEKDQLVELYEYFQGLPDGDQRRKLNEEHQELEDELLLFDCGVGDINSVIKEIADNLILIFQHAYFLDITDTEIKSALKEKLSRTLHRKATKYYEKHR